MRSLTRILTRSLLMASCGSAPASLQAADIIVDNKNSTAVTLVPATNGWFSSKAKPGYEGDNYLHDNNADKGSRSVRFTPDLPAAGIYEVFARWTSDAKRATNAPYDITTAGGIVA